MSKLRFGIIGCGGLGKGHLSNLLKMPEVAQVVALCDVDEEQFTKVTNTNLGAGDSFDVSSFNLYTDAEKMLENEELDAVVVALPTYLHPKYSIMALDKGLHVLCEKPMALNKAECQRMIDAAKRNNKLLTIGQCVRYDPAYKLVKEAYDSGKYGKLQRLELTRYSLTVTWGWEDWYSDFEKSGGAATDLHVHDVDFINYLLGRPDAVESDAIHTRSGYDCISTKYIYKDGPIVHATGDWSLPASYGFCPDIFAVFEKAVIRKDGKDSKVCPVDGDAFIVERGDANPYYDEMEYFIKCIKEGKLNDIVPMESTMQSIEMVEAEIKSAKIGEVVSL